MREIVFLGVLIIISIFWVKDYEEACALDRRIEEYREYPATTFIHIKDGVTYYGLSAPK